MTGGAVILAAPASGSGKTLVTQALLRQLKRTGAAIAAAKVGPDYIDPRFHEAACGGPCINLDPWAMRPGLLRHLAAEAASGGRLLLIEGVMGLFDGAADGAGSTADLAALTGWPVVLVIDVAGQAQSVAATVMGFQAFRPDVRIAGVILNRVRGPRHEALLRAALARRTMPVLGAMPADPALALPARHLGLVPAAEHPELDRFLDHAADIAAAHIDVAALAALAAPAAPATAPARLRPLGQRIAIADDVAFAFAYPHLLAGWRAAGAEPVPFSPLADEPPDPAADAIFLPGGYPELHGGRLAGNRRFLDGLRRAAAGGVAIYGECGGYMVLGDGLEDAEGARHAMAGLLPLETSFARRGLTLGYRRFRLLADGPLGSEGAVLAGHEFHHATILREGDGQRFAEAWDAVGTALGSMGLRRGTVAGSFLHVIDLT